MKTHRSDIISVILIVIAIALSFYFYAHFPARVPTHWGINGEPNAYSSAAFGAFFFPALILAVYLLLTFIPRIDPKHARYEEFKKAYGVFKGVIVLFLVVIYIITGLSGLGYSIKIDTVVPVMVGILFMVLGNYFGKIRNNWFVGIRNPWTLSNEEVWNKTHRVGGWLFVGGGLLLALIGFLPSAYKFFVFMLVLLVIVIVPNVYSYLLFRNTRNGGGE